MWSHTIPDKTVGKVAIVAIGGAANIIRGCGLNTWASAFQAEDAGGIPVTRSNMTWNYHNSPDTFDERFCKCSEPPHKPPCSYCETGEVNIVESDYYDYYAEFCDKYDKVKEYKHKEYLRHTNDAVSQAEYWKKRFDEAKDELYHLRQELDEKALAQYVKDNSAYLQTLALQDLRIQLEDEVVDSLRIELYEQMVKEVSDIVRAEIYKKAREDVLMQFSEAQDKI